MNTKPYRRSLPTHLLILLVTCLGLSAPQGFCAEPYAAPALVSTPVVATNYTLVTNVVLVTVTNYVVTTNIVFSTNAFTEAPDASMLQRSTAPRPALPDLSWVPPIDGYDWIQLNTGEWLKGRIKAMQERQIEFFSEKLSDVTFDWKDIRQVRSPRTLDVLFVDGKKVSGPVTVTPAQVTVGGSPPYAVPRG